MDIYGKGFTLYGNLDDTPIDREDIFERWKAGEFDVTVFSSIYRQQPQLADYRNYGIFKNVPTKWVFLDGEDDGFPCVYDAARLGTYFKRENPFNDPDVKIIGLSIPACKLLPAMPEKKKKFTAHVQCQQAYEIGEVANNCTPKANFATELEYYSDLADSKYGITMKKSGWDVPRHIENAAHFVVNCIYNHGWDQSTFDGTRDMRTHPLGLEDMKNCVVWNTSGELMEKINQIESEGRYDQLSKASRAWAETKTCEKMAQYVLDNI